MAAIRLPPEIGYTGLNGIELRARAIYLGGGSDADFGARQNRRRIELLFRLFF